ncbi:cell adhesion molecule CEACAM1-like [Calonectris borealis]|uniref:cell adhesion molecule CEACAM1-like n=1 Tax=Calonectris borealis TaxID=1323832 RepID=UPI003F4BB4DA
MRADPRLSARPRGVATPDTARRSRRFAEAFIGSGGERQGQPPGGGARAAARGAPSLPAAPGGVRGPWGGRGGQRGPPNHPPRHPRRSLTLSPAGTRSSRGGCRAADAPPSGPLSPPGPPRHLAAGGRRLHAGAGVTPCSWAALLLSCPPPARGQAPHFALRQDPAAARAGGDVSFALEPAPGRVLFCSWHRAATADVDFEIFNYFNEPNLGQQNGPAYTGRETGAADCSMRITRLRLNDSGVYTVTVRQPAVTTASIDLIVHVLLTQPAVMPDNVTVTENDTVTLTCRSPPSTQRVAWLRDGVPVSAGGRLSLSLDNRTLTVRLAQRGDAGAYACQVSNAISTNRSDDATVTVVYGPDAVTVTPPGPLDLLVGSPVTLTCAAAAVPAPHYTWFFGATRHPGATWVLDRLSPAHGGGYVCQALNPHSGRGRNSSRLELRVWELLTQPAVTPDNVTVAENDTVTLTCRSPPGTQTVAWLRDGAPVSAGGRLSLSLDNRTLTVRPAQRGDAGAYACQVSNAISTNRSDDINITVVYGPDGVTVTPPGPLRLRLGSHLELRCAAAAAPPPLFAWARGNASLAAGSCLRLDFGDPGQAGEYRCRATNPALGRAAEAAVLLLQEEGLGSGAIAGVVLGTLLGLGLLGAAGFLLWRRIGRASAPASPDGAKPSAPPSEAPAADGVDSTEEVKYSTLTFSAPGGPAPHSPPQLDGGTVYSEVRRK